LSEKVKVRDAASASRKHSLLGVVTEVGAPVWRETTAPRRELGIDVALTRISVAARSGNSDACFVHRKRLRGGIPSAAVFVEMKLRAHRSVCASVGADWDYVAARINDLLVRLDAMLSESERERRVPTRL